MVSKPTLTVFYERLIRWRDAMPSLGMLDMGSMSNTTRYGVLIDGRRGGYGVFPDLPGCY